jgi:hypothetical protein
MLSHATMAAESSDLVVSNVPCLVSDRILGKIWKILPSALTRRPSDIIKDTYVSALDSLTQSELSDLKELLKNVVHSFSNVDWRVHAPACFRVPVMELDMQNHIEVWRNEYDVKGEEYSATRLKGYAFVVAMTLVHLGYRIGITRDATKKFVLYCTIVDSDYNNSCIPYGKTYGQ